jgi:chorismate mutase
VIRNDLQIDKIKMIRDKTMKQMSLSEISRRLESFEETIVFKLLDRAQFDANEIVYENGKSGFKGAGNASLLELRLACQEKIDAQFGKFCTPEERPFIDNSAPRRRAMADDHEIVIDDYNVINLTGEIMAAYRSLVPLFCRTGNDGHLGSSVEHDVYALQAISRRVHFGSLYAAECKFRSDPEGFDMLIDANDREGLLDKLTRKDVEDKIIGRIREKTISTQAMVNGEIRRVIKPEVVVDFYRQHIIPLTKKGQVLYMLNRKRKERPRVVRHSPFFLLDCLKRGRQEAAAGAC